MLNFMFYIQVMQIIKRRYCKIFITVHPYESPGFQSPELKDRQPLYKAYNLNNPPVFPRLTYNY
jgi:hypothetical protein